ncbi:MAG: helix-turn-helix domain-containing protein [Rhodobacteraceae bacterium]|nr:helix-turn-helix domain-containing protein [Paracoccaceae bacterium]
MEAQQIGELLKDRNIVLKGGDVISNGGGFTQVPNFILVSGKISVGAKLTYAMLLKYAWQNDYCFPGQEKLADDIGVGKRSIVRWVKELEEADFLTVKRRGLGKSNLYELTLTSQKRHR